MPKGRWARQKRKKSKETRYEVPDQVLDQYRDEIFSGELEKNISVMKDLLGGNFDFEIRRFHIFGKTPAALVYLKNMTDQVSINHDLLKPMMQITSNSEGQSLNASQLRNLLIDDILYHTECRSEPNLATGIQAVLQGNTVILIEGLKEALLSGTRKIPKRQVTRPQTEQVVRGSHEGNIESLGTNVSLLRTRLPTVDLQIQKMDIGRITKSDVAVCYLKSIASEGLVQEVKDRLSLIDIDGPIDSGYLEQFIEDDHFSPFPQIQITERPDKTAASLMEGRVAIMMNGTPVTLIVPAVFSQFYQSVDDYSERFLMGTLVRIIRVVSLAFSLILPSLYVALISFNPELIPTDFAVAVAGGRAGIPFPPVLEVLYLVVTMEVLREATIRMPQQVGGAISIVGVLVIGQAAVQAGFASPITIVVVALTTIGSFATPAYNAGIALRMLKFPLLVLSGIFGLYGIAIGLLFIVNHMLSLKSFGVPYMSPTVPGNYQGLKDVVIRAPLWWMPERPDFLDSRNRKRRSHEKQAATHATKSK